MDEEQLIKMEGATGKIPLFLDAILRMGDPDASFDFDFDKAYQQLLKHKLVQEMQTQLNQFS
jgi:hypothetical protein